MDTTEKEAIYWCLTFSGLRGDWHRGKTIQEVQEAIAVRNGKMYKNLVYVCLLKHDTTEEEKDKLLTFWNVTDFGGLNTANNLTEEDKQLIKDKFEGWLNLEFDFEKKKTKKK